MVPTFILTRTFAISALFAGAFSVAYAAPVASPVDGMQVLFVKRSCRQMGCLFEVPTHSESAPESNVSTATAVEPVDDSVPTAAVAVVVVVPPQDVAAGGTVEAVFSVADSSDEDVHRVIVVIGIDVMLRPPFGEVCQKDPGTRFATIFPIATTTHHPRYA
ncbi:hypothetical protein C8Q79DRAFT_1011251 [Trametes meyenii]|nr:hypothetical protein C8Q79DRAFT_1011251 [Trametes meyenii]